MGSLNLPGGLTASQQALLARLSLLAAGGADELTPARSAALANLDAAISSRASAVAAANLDAPISSRASAAALQLVDDFVDDLELRLTTARAGYLDVLNALQAGATGVPIVYPALANAVLPSGGGAWLFGAWVQIVAAVAGSRSLAGIYVAPPATGRQYDIEVGHGAVGAEVVIARFHHNYPTGVEGPLVYLPCAFPVQIAENARLAVRIAGDVGAANLHIKALTIPRPVL